MRTLIILFIHKSIPYLITVDFEASLNSTSLCLEASVLKLEPKTDGIEKWNRAQS